jgi:two-component system, NarL family, nitrate/nitrite response regulator NarL
MTTRGYPVAVVPVEEGSPRGLVTSPPRVFVVSDIRLVCEGLILGLSQEPSVIVVGSSDLSQSLTNIGEACPDVVLLDVAGPGNIKLSRPLRELLPDAKIVAFAVAEKEEIIIACAEAGISGYVPRTASLEDVVAAIHAAIRGRALLLAAHRRIVLPRRRAPATAPDVLTQREKQIIALVEQGFSNKEIARSLHIGNATAKNHVHNILSKLQVRRRGEAAARIRQANAEHLGRDDLLFLNTSVASRSRSLDHPK